MSRIPASPQELESLLEARSRLRADGDGRSPWRGREEPRMSAERAHDADMLDVVQKFERVYAQLGAEQRERPHAPELAARAAAALNEASVSTLRDAPAARSDAPEVSSGIEVSAAASALEVPFEKYELPELDAIPPITGGTRTPAAWGGAERPARRSWRLALASAAIALIIGIAVGYLMVPSADSTRPRAKIDASQQGGTQLRLDYDLPKR
jgi:anti-sigma-K factor RskA